MSPSAESVAGDEDLLTEILVRLPPKSLSIFKCLCRHWKWIISSPEFAKSHLLLRTPAGLPTSGIFLRRISSSSSSSSSSFPVYQYQFLSLTTRAISTPTASPIPNCNPSRFKILQSCNGLLLLCCGISRSNRDYCVDNPVNNLVRTLPSLPLGISPYVMGYTLAFDARRSGFYKVVLVATTAASAYQYQIFVFSPCDNHSDGLMSWRSWSGNCFLAPFDTAFSDGVYWNGAVHWA